MIPEPQKTYVLELLYALGTTADEFVVAGAQAMKFMMERARATKDIDFVLDVVRLRSEPLLLSAQLEKLGYAVVDGSRNFQFEKPIPNSRETMRIEFMAPEEFKRAERDFRVDIQKGVHARACTGGTIAVAESKIHQLTGRLPDGSDFTAQLRVFAWHPDQKLPSFKPQIAHRNKPIERVRIPACSCRKVDTRTALVTDGSYSP